MELKDEAMKESVITLEDFPFICRICCLKRSDLRLFEEEDYLFDLFHTIRKIDASSRDAFPKSVCNGCVNILEDISMFIDISKYSDANFGKNMQPKPEIIERADELDGGLSRESVKIIEENGDDMVLQASEICRFCSSSSSSLTSFEEKSHLMQVFQKITNIDLKAEFHSPKIINICSKCNNELEKISSFISSSLCNEQKLGIVIGLENNVKTENYFNHIDSELLTCYGSTAEDSFDNKSFSLESKAVIYIKEELMDSEPNYHKGMIIHSRTSPERKPFDGGPFEEVLVKKSHLSSPLNNLGIDVDLKTKNGKKQFNCACCEKRFTRKYNLQKHLLIHAGKKTFKCNCCEKTFIHKADLQNHLFIHTGKKPFKCDDCGRRFNRNWNLQTHLRIHAGKKPFKCHRCDKAFIHKSKLRYHLSTHAGNKPFKCDYCDKSFILKCLVKQHMITHTGEKPFKCVNCDKGFHQKSHLKQHMRIHTGEKLFKCDCCEKCFYERSHLQLHLLTHTGEKLFNCDICKKGFNRKSCWKQHMNTHTGEKPFKCDCCQRSFHQKRYLQKHLLTHATEKRFKCSCCKQTFNYKCRLQQHMLTHSREKTFKCADCNKEFKVKHELQQHLLIHTEEKLFKCECCEKSFLLLQSLQKHYAHSHKKVVSK